MRGPFSALHSVLLTFYSRTTFWRGESRSTEWWEVLHNDVGNECKDNTFFPSCLIAIIISLYLRIKLYNACMDVRDGWAKNCYALYITFIEYISATGLHSHYANQLSYLILKVIKTYQENGKVIFRGING